MPRSVLFAGEPRRCRECGYFGCVCKYIDVPDSHLSPYGAIGDCSCGKKNVRLTLETSWGPGSLELCWECWRAGPEALHKRYKENT